MTEQDGPGTEPHGEGGAPTRGGLLTPAEAAARLGVAPRTLARWERAGRLVAVRTPGGHRRFRAQEVDALVAAGPRRDPAG